MKTFDVKLGPTLVLVTTMDRDAAGRISEAIEAERGSLFQCEGLLVTVSEVERDGPTGTHRRRSVRGDG